MYNLNFILILLCMIYLKLVSKWSNEFLTYFYFLLSVIATLLAGSYALSEIGSIFEYKIFWYWVLFYIYSKIFVRTFSFFINPRMLRIFKN